MVCTSIKGWLKLTLRPRSVLDCFFNWDLELGRLGISVCYHRPHKLGISWRLKGQSYWAGRSGYWYQYWALLREKGWQTDKYHGELLFQRH